MCFIQDGAISSLNSKSLKLIDQFIYLGTNTSSTESDVKICIEKVWLAIDVVITILKSHLSDKVKQ